MARIHRDAFVEHFRNLRLEADAPLPGGLDPSTADLDQDGFVQGEPELEALFYAVDDFDTNGDRHSVDASDPSVAPIVEGLRQRTARPPSGISAAELMQQRNAAPAEAGRLQPRAGTTYRVRPGDTLSQIAATAYGSSSQWPAIRDDPRNAGRIGAQGQVEAGRVIHLPPKPGPSGSHPAPPREEPPAPAPSQEARENSPPPASHRRLPRVEPVGPILESTMERLLGTRGTDDARATHPNASVQVLNGYESVDLQPDPAAGVQVQSNNPELLTDASFADLESGVLTVSTHAPVGKEHPEAHLDHPLEGSFSFASSHQNRSSRTVSSNVVWTNPTDAPVTVRIHANVSETSRSAPYRAELSGVQTDRQTDGPGHSVAARQAAGEVDGGPTRVTIPPGGSYVVRSDLHPPGTERMTQINAEVEGEGQIHAALLYSAAPLHNDQGASSTQAASLLRSADLVPLGAHERAHPPSPVEIIEGDQDRGITFGRVSGVTEPGAWRLSGEATNSRFGYLLPSSDDTMPQVDRYLVAPKASRQGARFEDGAYVPHHVSPELVATHPGSAPLSHGNYFADLTTRFPLNNPTDDPLRVRIYVDVPPEPNSGVSKAIRAPVRARVGSETTDHQVYLESGQESRNPVVDVVVPPRSNLPVEVTIFNAANNTPPFALRVETTRP